MMQVRQTGYQQVGLEKSHSGKVLVQLSSGAGRCTSQDLILELTSAGPLLVSAGAFDVSSGNPHWTSRGGASTTPYHAGASVPSKSQSDGG